MSALGRRSRDDTINEAVGEVIEQLSDAGWTIAEISQKLGRPKDTISRWCGDHGITRGRDMPDSATGGVAGWLERQSHRLLAIVDVAANLTANDEWVANNPADAVKLHDRAVAVMQYAADGLQQNFDPK